jgi:hypothetical protein
MSLGRLMIVPLLLVVLASVVSAQQVLPNSKSPACAVGPEATYPSEAYTYPMTSNQYAVQYLSSDGVWTDARVYISTYGETDASPYRVDSGYLDPYLAGQTEQTSMSFVSIPTVGKNNPVALRVTLLSGGPFRTSDQVSVRPKMNPSIGPIVSVLTDGTEEISTTTAADFNGEQFILWWHREDLTSPVSLPKGGGFQGLAIFLDPAYTEPTGSNVQIINNEAVYSSTISTSTTINTLDFEGTVAVGGTGDQALVVPANISAIYLGSGAWVQGKFYFMPNKGKPRTMTIRGPGVLDVSRFQYDLRSCGASTGVYADQSYDALEVTPPAGSPDDDSLNNFDLEGFIISDTNHAADAPLFKSTVTNVKTISWNGENAALKLQDNTTASNVFVRSGDDSLMMWGSGITVTNATVWQNYNGGVVNLGWSNNSPGTGDMINGLYVVKTDWFTPKAPGFKMTGPDFTLKHQNNAVIASMMIPGTNFGASCTVSSCTPSPSLFENIYVDDPPQVLFSLKILPPDCGLTSSVACSSSMPVNLLRSSTLNLNIENLVTPPSMEENSIGFETLAGKLLDAWVNPFTGLLLRNPYTLTGTMNISLTNVSVGGTALTSTNALSLGKVHTHDDDDPDDHINVQYNPTP